MTAIVLRGDARALPLPDASVDLIVTSPPYWGLRSYRDGGEHYEGQIGDEQTPAAYVGSLLACTREWVRALKPSGSLWVNLGDKYGSGNVAGVPDKSLIGLPWRYAIGCIDELGLILRAEVIWSKPNGLPENAPDRVRRSHEQWFHFSMQPQYFASVGEIREPHKESSVQRASYAVVNTRGPNRSRYDRQGGHEHVARELNQLGKLPGSVWEISTQPLKVPVELDVDHFAAFPTEWPRRLILAWSPPDGVVLDPFGGTGTTALVADVLGRRGISVDRSADYCRIAQWRTTDRGERARAAGKPKPPPEPLGDRLFEVES